MSAARRSHGLAEAAENLDLDVDVPFRPLVARSAPQPVAAPDLLPAPASYPPIISPIRAAAPAPVAEEEAQLVEHDPSRFKQLVADQFPVKEEMRKTSMSLPVYLDLLLTRHVNRENEKPRRVKVTREAVVADALRRYFNVE